MTIYGMSDKAILQEIGGRLKNRRLNRNLTQQEVADQAGLTRTTVGEFERGASSSMLTLIRILRVLDSLEELDSFLPDTGPSPLQLARFQGRQRQRASRKKPDGDSGGEDPEW
ncbi:MAG: helix-turn-helix transcriptional regulator [Candidatus Krumholzibacteriota bacterium]